MAHLFANDTIGPLYQEQLRKEHDGSKWGSTGARYSGRDILRLLEERPYIHSVLDFGAGKGSLEEFVQEWSLEVGGRQLDWTNYDPGIPEYDTLPDRDFDLVITTDVLEHVEPDLLEHVIKQLEARAGKVMYNDIACYPTGKLFGEGPYKGEDLHLTVQSPQWWKDTFKANSTLHMAEYHWRSKYSRGKYKDRCMMIHERV